jgi:hypothetical protein
MMIKTMKMAVLMLLAAVVVFTSAGCAKPSIVGYWQSNNNLDTYLEFTEDGTLIVDEGNNVITGTYEVISDNYLKIEMSGLAGLLLAFVGDTVKYEVTDMELTLTKNNNSKTFTRVDK